MSSKPFEITKTRCEKALAATGIDLASHSINPYRGCSFGCFYCYSRLNKNIRKNPIPFGHFVDVKENIVEILEKELNTISPERIILGSVTEPFQEVEKLFSLSLKVIECLKKKELPLVILTKSELILSALPFFKDYKDLTIYYTVNSPLVQKLFETRAPDAMTRFKVLKMLTEEKFQTIAYISPYFPEISDLDFIFEQLESIPANVHFEWMNFHIINKGQFLEILEQNSAAKIGTFYKNFFSDQNFREITILNERKRILEKAASCKKEVNIHFDDNDPYFQTISYK